MTAVRPTGYFLETGGEQEESIYDERIGVRRLGFRNVEAHPERINLPMDTSAESLASAGTPPWLVGSMCLLVPSVLDIEYWQHQGWTRIFRPGDERGRISKQSKTFDTWNEALKMVVQFDFLDSGQVQMRSQLLAPRARKQWERARGRTEDLDHHQIVTCLDLDLPGRRNRLLPRRRIHDQQHMDGEAVVIQESLHGAFPMGAYHGSDYQSRLVLHQSGLYRVGIIDPIGLRVRTHIAYSDLNRHFAGVPCVRPLSDPRTSEVINVLVEYPKRAFHGMAKYRVISLTGQVGTLQESSQVGRVLATFQAPATLLKSFALTPRFIIVPIHSLRYSKRMPDFDANITVGIEEFLEWHEDADTLFYIISREEEQLVAVYRSEPSYIDSILNAFEGGGTPMEIQSGGSIYLDLVASSTPPPLLTLNDLRNTTSPADLYTPLQTTLRRYSLFRLGEEIARFDGAAGQLPAFPLALFHSLTDYSLHTPLINSSWTGAPHRYAFGMGIDRDNRGRPGFLPNCIIKSDLVSPFKTMQFHRTGTYPSPVLLVSRSELGNNPFSEDDGVIITVLLDVRAQRSFLLVIDARDMRELARYVLPRVLPLTNSSPVWLPAKSGTVAGSALVTAVEPPERTALLSKD